MMMMMIHRAYHHVLPQVLPLRRIRLALCFLAVVTLLFSPQDGTAALLALSFTLPSLTPRPPRRRAAQQKSLSSISSLLTNQQQQRCCCSEQPTSSSSSFLSLAKQQPSFSDTTEEEDDADASAVVPRTDVLLPFLPSSSVVSRRDAFWKIPIGVGFAYGYGKLVSQVVANTIRGTVYPEAHESRVRSTIEQTLVAAAAAAAAAATSSSSSRSSTTLRVLEVGIGNEARILRRGLYESALRQLALPSSSSPNIQKVELTGLDVQLPKTKVQQQVVDEQRQQNEQQQRIPVDVSFVEQSVESIPFEDGYFDAIVCSLTLCSVSDPQRAVQEMQRVLNPKGGTLGYVEHVAVNLDNGGSIEQSLGFLEWQQRFFDPVQQVLADNCHLHRTTQETIHSGMGVINSGGSTSTSSSNTAARARVLNEERFLVDAMWPVTMQCCGVVQRI